jgi:DNA-binding CsgD family transcriptional regulator
MVLEFLFPFRMPGMIVIRGISTTLFFLSWNLTCIFYIFSYYGNISFAPHSIIIPLRFKQEYRISKREEEIISLLLGQKSYREIAEKLFISIKTVETHISHIYIKTSVKNQKELVQKVSSYPY